MKTRARHRSDVMRATLVAVALLAVPALASAQVDEPPVVDPAVFPPLPAVPEALREHVVRARRLVRRTNRCGGYDRFDWGDGLREGFVTGPPQCDEWYDTVYRMPREVRIHAYGLEYVRDAMVEWPASAPPRFYQWSWLRDLGRMHQPTVERDHFHELQVPYLLRALSVLTRDTDRHRTNAWEVVRTLREVTLEPVVARTFAERDVPEDELERRRIVREAWLAWAREHPTPEPLDTVRARGIAAAEPFLSSDRSIVLLDAFYIRWRRNRVRDDWAALCRQVLASPALTDDDRRAVQQRCTYSRIGWREMARLHREARAARNAEAPSSARSTDAP